MTGPSSGDETALLLPMPGADAWIGALRERFDPSAHLGLPAHVTLLYPFRPQPRIDDAVVAELAALFGSEPAIEFRLAGVAGFPSVVYVVPEPVERFDRLTRRLIACYPDCPPYRGAFPDPKPHLTVAQSPPCPDLVSVSEALLRAAEGTVPVRGVAREAWLAEERNGRWRCRVAFPLAGRGA